MVALKSRRRRRSDGTRAGSTRIHPKLEQLETRQLLTLTPKFDYSLDSAGFFATGAVRTVFESAVSAIVSRLGDTLEAVPSQTYDVFGRKVTTTIPQDTLLIYALGENIPPDENGVRPLAESSSYFDERYRGQDALIDVAPQLSYIHFNTF